MLQVRLPHQHVVKKFDPLAFYEIFQRRTLVFHHVTMIGQRVKNVGSELRFLNLMEAIEMWSELHST